MSKAPDVTIPGTACRRLLRNGRSAALATALARAEDSPGADWPYASLVTYACDSDGSPILLLSSLSDHTRNVAADPRGSLLVEAASRRANPQTGPRVSVLGRLAKTAEERHKRRFLARHPRAALYASFADFSFYRMAVERAHYVGGFARAVWVKGEDVVLAADAAATLAEIEESVLAHMNGDHAEAIDLYAAHLLGRRGQSWTLVGIDPDGADLRRGASFARLEFAAPVHDAGACRTTLAALAGEARAIAAAARPG